MVHRFVFTITLNIDVNNVGHLNFILMEEEESQAVGIVVEENYSEHNRQKSSCKNLRKKVQRNVNKAGSSSFMF